MNSPSLLKTCCSARITYDGYHSQECSRPAKYIYQCVAGTWEPLCGIHARRYKNSRSLRKLDEKA